MSNTKTTIIVENRCEEMFNYLPDAVSIKGTQSFAPIFGYGDEKELNAFLKNKHKSKARTPYPLIWLLYPYVETHNKKSVTIDSLSFILAVKGNTQFENKQRMQETYQKVLIPLFDNIRSLFKRANITSTDSVYTIVKYPNYSSDSEGTEHAGTFIWDALKFTLSITITDDCLNKISF